MPDTEGMVQPVVRHVGDTTVVEPVGDLDVTSSPGLRAVLLRELRREPSKPVVVDLSRACHIDSSGVASLVEGLKAARETGSRMLLVGLSEAAREVLQISRLSGLFEIYDTERDALKR